MEVMQIKRKNIVSKFLLTLGIICVVGFALSIELIYSHLAYIPLVIGSLGYVFLIAHLQIDKGGGDR